MSDVAERLKQEMEGLGHAPMIENHGANYPSVVVIEYDVQNGRFRGQKYRLGISMGGQMWPDYPPHFIHLPAVVGTPRDGQIYEAYSVVGADGGEYKWIVLSRPPGPFWDNLPTKSMQGYMEHIYRFWENI